MPAACWVFDLSLIPLSDAVRTNEPWAQLALNFYSFGYDPRFSCVHRNFKLFDDVTVLVDASILGVLVGESKGRVPSESFRANNAAGEPSA